MNGEETKRIETLEKTVTDLRIDQARKDTTLEQQRDELRRVAKSLLKQIDGVGGRIDRTKETMTKDLAAMKLDLKGMELKVQSTELTATKFEDRLKEIDGEEGKLAQIHSRITKLADRPWRLIKKTMIVVTAISGILGLIWIIMLIAGKL